MYLSQMDHRWIHMYFSSLSVIFLCTIHQIFLCPFIKSPPHQDRRQQISNVFFHRWITDGWWIHMNFHLFLSYFSAPYIKYFSAPSSNHHRWIVSSALIHVAPLPLPGYQHYDDSGDKHIDMTLNMMMHVLCMCDCVCVFGSVRVSIESFFKPNSCVSFFNLESNCSHLVLFGENTFVLPYMIQQHCMVVLDYYWHSCAIISSTVMISQECH